MRPEVHIFIVENMEIWKTNKKLFVEVQIDDTRSYSLGELKTEF